MNNKTDSILIEDLSTKAYKKIKEMIITGQLAPGQKLNQIRLADKLGISRTPLLQALNRLSSEQLTETIPRRGTRVRKFTNKDLLSVFEIRGRLEPYICELAAKEINDTQILLLKENIKKTEEAVKNNDQTMFKTLDNEFHTIVIESSKSSLVAEILQKYIPLMYAVNLLKPMEKSIQDHKNIVELLSERDALGASQLMHYHIYGSTKTKLLQTLNIRG